MSIAGVPMLLVPVLGPVLGGVITDTVSWRWIFYINVALGALAARLLPGGTGQTARPPLDWQGLLTLAPGLAAIVFGLSQAQSHGEIGSPAAWIPVVLGAVLVAAFAVRGRRAAHALIDIRLFPRPAFSAAAATIFFTGAALYGGLFITPLYYQIARGASPLTAGLLVAPQGIGAALAMPLAGRLTDRIGGGIVATAGLVICAAATVPLALVTATASYAWLAAVLLVRGLGIGSSLMPTTAAAYTTLERNEIPRATSAISVLQQLGGSIGVTILAVTLQSRIRTATAASARASAFAGTFTWAAVLAAVALAAAVTLAITAYRYRHAHS